MVAYRDVVLKEKAKQDKKQDKLLFTRAVLTDAQGNQTGSGSVWASQSERRVWAMTAGAIQPGQVLCVRVSDPVIGLGVIIGYADGSNEKEVLSDDFFLRKTGDPTGWYSTSPGDLEPGGLKMMWLYSKAIVPLATYPDPTGLSVNIIAGDYPYAGTRKTFAGQSGYLLAAPGTVGHHYYAGLYLDSSNALQVVYGTSVVVATTPPEPSWPAGAFRLSVVKIANGQTSLDFNDDVFDRRMLWSDELAGAAGWPFANVLTVSSTDADAQYTTIALAIAAASDGDVILVDAETISLSATITIDKSITLTSLGETIITSSVAGPTIEITDVAGATLNNLTIRNTGAGAKSGCVKWAVDDVVIRDCLLEKLSGASTVSYCLWQLGGSGHIIDTNVECTDPPGTNYGYLNDTADSSVTITRGTFAGVTQDVFTARAGSNIIGEFFTANDVSWAGTSNGWYFDSGDLVSFGMAYVDGYTRGIIKVKNTSGATAAANEVGYIDSAGEYKTTTTANLDAAWCVVITGGANNADIYVVRNGRVTVNYTSTAPSAGHYLVTATVAGQALRQTTMRPEIFAICTAAGSGGTVEALLLTGRILRPATDTHFIYGIEAASDSDFVATIATYDGVQTLTYNAPSSGNENTIAYWTALDLAFNAKLVLHNTTRGNSARISSVTVGTNTIVIVAADASPAGWAVGDTITTRSQTATGPWTGTSYYFEWDMSSWTAKPALAVAIVIEPAISDTSTTVSALSSFHPFEAQVASKNFQRWTQAGNAASARFIAPVTVPLLNNKFCFGWDAAGSATTTVYGQLAGWIVAVP